MMSKHRKNPGPCKEVPRAAGAFFIIGPAHHHLYYLVPLIRTTNKKELCLIGGNEKYIKILKTDFPDINLVTFANDDPKMIGYFNSYKYIFHSNASVLFEKFIRPRLSPGKVLVNVQHFSPIKFVDDIPYILSNFLWDVTVAAGRKDIDLLERHGLINLNNRKHSNPMRLNINGRPVLVILGGNLRVRDYLTHRTPRETVFSRLPKLNPANKTILYMPTFSYSVDRSRSNYCSIPFFAELLNKLKNPQNYNFIFKLHPNLVYEQKMIETLLLAAQRRSLAFHLDFFGADYLSYMEIADILVSDRTSAAMDFFYFDKPVFFLDHNNECPSNITFDDITNSYWSYQFGPVISRANINDIDALFTGSLTADTYVDKRKKCRDYMFTDTLSISDIFEEIEGEKKCLK